MGKRLDNEQTAKLREAIIAAAGEKSAAEIERETGVSYKTVQKHAALLGVELACGRGRRITEAEYQPEDICDAPEETYEGEEPDEPEENYEGEELDEGADEQPRRRRILKCPNPIDGRAGELFAALSDFFGKIAEIFGKNER